MSACLLLALFDWSVIKARPTLWSDLFRLQELSHQVGGGYTPDDDREPVSSWRSGASLR